MDLVVLTDGGFREEPNPDAEIRRSIELTNEDWLVLSQCAEAFAQTFRSQHSQLIATYVTRGDYENATKEAQKMNELIHKLDKLQVALMS